MVVESSGEYHTASAKHRGGGRWKCSDRNPDAFIEPSRPSSWPLLAGAGIAAIAGTGVAIWWFRERSRQM
ncbi:MAG TPA: hypothetical protein VJ742_05495 [Nitrososphaera sp.]|nr:hypothetical protein [Nitrososphaera sp.]